MWCGVLLASLVALLVTPPRLITDPVQYPTPPPLTHTRYPYPSSTQILNALPTPLTLTRDVPKSLTPRPSTLRTKIHHPFTPNPKDPNPPPLNPQY